jgi:hypothetical protein
MSKNTQVATPETNTAAAAFNPQAFKIKKKLVIPTIKLETMKPEDALYFTALGEISEKFKTDDETGEIKTDKDGKKEVLHLLEISVLGSAFANEMNAPKAGTEGQIVIGAILVRALKGEGEIAGRKFAIKKGESLGTAKARLWELVEIE